jgi:hypothetical protein
MPSDVGGGKNGVDYVKGCEQTELSFGAEDDCEAGRIERLSECECEVRLKCRDARQERWHMRGSVGLAGGCFSDPLASLSNLSHKR